MSAVADFRMIETAQLNELLNVAPVKIEKKLFSKKIVDSYPEYLESISQKLIDFKWSGYIFADLFIFLAERKQIDLLNSEYDAIANSISECRSNSTIILTYMHKQKFMDDLSPDKFTKDELIAFNKDFSERDDLELVEAELAGIEALQRSLRLIPDNTHVIILSVG